jgi:hypothetical protein
VDVAAAHQHLVAVIRHGLDRPLLVGGQLGQRQKSEVRVPGRDHTERTLLDQCAHLRRGPDEGGQLEAELLLHRRSDHSLVVGRLAGRPEH